MPDKKLTPMMELIEKLNQQKRILKEGFVEGKWNDDRCSEIDNCIQLAEIQLEKERQMVIDAHIEGQCEDGYTLEIKAEQYYTQTYKS